MLLLLTSDMPRSVFSSSLIVPGLAEKRPSVLVGWSSPYFLLVMSKVKSFSGDRILVQKEGAPAGEWYEGGVHVVRMEEVGLCFNRSFSGWTPQQRYNARFKLNRFPVRRQHQALDTAFSEERILFPTKTHIPNKTYPNQANARFKVVNPLIASNPPQLQAVTSIMKQAPGSAPFVIFGP